MSHAKHLVSSEFSDEVLNSTTPVLVDFYATWCPPCKMLSPVVDQLAGEFAGRVKVVKVNVDEETALAGAFRIESVPTLIAFHEGKVVHRSPGAPSASSLRNFLGQLAGLGNEGKETQSASSRTA
jgi:thioredoxin 1